MNETEVFAAVAAHRRRAADLFAALDDEQWRRASLCADWTVRDVAGHLVVPFEVTTVELVAQVLRRRGSIDAAMDHVSRRAAQQSTTHLVTALRRHADSRFRPPMLPPEAPLTDIVVHLCDVARPLDLELDITPAMWTPVLDFLVSTPATRAFVRHGHLDGLHLLAADQQWESGEGSPVRGSSEALALAITGRPAALSELDGPGVPVLTARMTPPPARR